MRKYINGFPVLFALLLFSCSDFSKDSLDYRQLSYDSSRIRILRWDTLNSKFPKSSDPIVLTQNHLHLIDSLLSQAVDSFNRVQNGRIKELMATYDNRITDPKLFLLDLSHFKMEYLPYNDVNHRDIVEVNCYCDGSENSRMYETIWGRRSFCHFKLTIDLKLQKASEIFIDYNFG